MLNEDKQALKLWEDYIKSLEKADKNLHQNLKLARIKVRALKMKKGPLTKLVSKKRRSNHIDRLHKTYKGKVVARA